MKLINRLPFIITFFLIFSILYSINNNKNISAQVEGSCDCSVGVAPNCTINDQCNDGYFPECWIVDCPVGDPYCYCSGCSCQSTIIPTNTPTPGLVCCGSQGVCEGWIPWPECLLCPTGYCCESCIGVTPIATPIIITIIPTPSLSCRCHNNIAEGMCAIDDYCGNGYVERCTSYPHCRDSCSCLLPTITPDPGGCLCDFAAGCKPFPIDTCALNYTPECHEGDYGLCTPCVCQSPTPSPAITGVPVSCSSLCPTGVPYKDFIYGRCFTGDNPDEPTPGVFDCDNTNTDCAGVTPAADCYCCKYQDSPPAPTREFLNPLCPGGIGINTAIGCIPVGNKDDFLAFILKWALGIAGGVAFILIVFSGFLYMTSAGDKQKVQAAKELMTAAISGLLLLIFSVFILDLFGIRILQIPGL